MGDKYFTIDLNEKTPTRDGFKSCTARLSEKRRRAAEELARSAKNSMASPMAVFRTIYGDGHHKRFRLCGIFEKTVVIKKMAKIAARRARDGDRILIYSNLEYVEEYVRKKIKKAKKNVPVSTFNRGDNTTTIFVIN